MRTQGQRRYKRKIDRRNAVIAGLTLASITGSVLPAWAARQAPAEMQHCDTRIIQRGDTIWRLFDGDMARATALNTHITNLSLVYPGDQIVMGCAPEAQSAPIVVEAMAADHSLVDVSQWLDEREPDGRLTWHSIVAHLYQAGFVGNDLLVMSAITPGESSRMPGTEGDQHLADSKWGNSISPWMIRSVRAQKGTGSLRDEDRLRTLPGAASAAFELVEQTKELRDQGKINPVTKAIYTPFDPWTAYTNGSWKQHIEFARQAALEMEVL